MQNVHSNNKSSAQPLPSNVVRLRPELPDVLAPLMESDRWVLWKYRKRNGETTKPPYSDEDKFASTRDEDTWLSYRQAMRAFKEGWAEGIGFNIGDGIGAIDLDHCLDGETVAEWAREIIDQTKSYVEVTPSGKGLRVIGFTRGENVHTNRKRGDGKLELYRGDCGRYITVTGRTFRDCAGLISIDELIDKLASNKDSDDSPSAVFHSLCCRAFDRGKGIEWIIGDIERHPRRWEKASKNGRGLARYIEDDRLAGEIERCRERWGLNNPDKAERFGQDKDTPLKQTGVTKKLIGLRPASAIEPRDHSWEWWPWIAREEMFFIMSKGGVGKGLMVSDLVARMTTGNKWPLSNDRADKGKVYWFESEDNLDTTIVPRLMAAGADLDRVLLCEREPQTFWKLKKADLEKNDVGMVVLSPLLSYLDIENFRDEMQVRDALEELSDKIRGIACTVIALLHPNKRADLDAVERVLGSVAFTNFVRSLAILREEPDGLVRVVHAKRNLGVKADDLLFNKYNTQPLKHARGQYIGINWEKAEQNIDEGEVLKSIKRDDDKSVGPWLERHLDDNEWHLADDVLKAGDKVHFLAETIKKAKLRNSAIVHESRGFPSKVYWKLKRGKKT